MRRWLRSSLPSTAVIYLSTLFAVFAPGAGAAAPDLSLLRLPADHAIEIWADGIAGARSMARSPRGTVFVGTRDGGGRVYAIREIAPGQRRARIIAAKLNMPNGIAFRDGALYVAESDKILRFDDIDADLDALQAFAGDSTVSNVELPRKPVIVATLPSYRHHGWRYLGFGPDGKLYLPLGVPCNVCDKDAEGLATIVRMNADGSGYEIVARGVRNSVGFAWHPRTGELWFTDNGRDMLGDDTPPCELNRLSRPGEHFGFPFCHGSDVVDPEFGTLGSCATSTLPVQNLGPHVAPLGMLFRDENTVLIAEHGSWNRSQKIGYRLTRVRLEGNRAVAYEEFIGGWLQPGEKVIGRPVDLMTLPDGSLLVSDDFAGVIYRVRSL